MAFYSYIYYNIRILSQTQMKLYLSPCNVLTCVNFNYIHLYKRDVQICWKFTKVSVQYPQIQMYIDSRENEITDTGVTTQKQGSWKCVDFCHAIESKNGK